MKFFKWRFFIITSLVCLLPILLGVSLWNSLPDSMAIHFDFRGAPDQYAPKGFVVFGLPVLMVVLQGICCLIYDINSYKHGERKKFELVTKWIVPALTVTLQVITLGYGLGWNLDIRKAVSLIVAILFLTIGNYLPKFDQVKHYNVDTEKARKINRFVGYETVTMGLLFFVSIFLPPVVSTVCLFLLIPYAALAVIYGIIIGRK